MITRAPHQATDHLSVSLNGVDNIGKTTQLAWLHRGWPEASLVGSVNAWDQRWEHVAGGDFAHWWFVTSTTAEHVNLVLRSHLARRRGSGPIALEDRGLPMLRATCAATAAVKEALHPAEALARVDKLAAHLTTGLAAAHREFHVLLRRSTDTRQEADEALRRETQPVDERYAAYQLALAEILALQVAHGDYHVVLDVADAPILTVQKQIRGHVIDHLAGTEHTLQPLPLDRLPQVWLLGGMSESGKSTIGELLRDEHGVTRLKIGYLLDVAALRAGVSDPYEAWTEQEQATRLTDEILRFADATKAPAISLESAHRFDAVAHLKATWGDRLQVLYADAPFSLRATRTSEPEAQLKERDSLKARRGADRIIDIADHVIDNSTSLGGLKTTVATIAHATILTAAAPEPREPATQAAWLREVVTHLSDEQVALILATGSTGTSEWRSGWSDLDLLVVRDTLPAAWLREVADTVRSSDGVKVGLSVFTPGDIDALRVPPRVVQSLCRAATGRGVLHRRPGYEFPVPTRAIGDRTSRGELGLVMMTTRRLLATSAPDVRALHKHLVLLGKIALRANGVDLHDPDDVLAAFAQAHPSAEWAMPRLDDIVNDPGDQHIVDRVVAATDQILAVIDRSVATATTATQHPNPCEEHSHDR